MSNHTMTGLYLHIPFCVKKCLYCDFYSLPTSNEPIGRRLQAVQPPKQSAFLDALEAELTALPDGFQPDTIFVGGGTPTELADDDFDRLMATLHRHVDLCRVREWTCESNPGTLTSVTAATMREAGVTRVSLGVQSFQDRNLETLGRIHTAAEAEAGFHLLRDHGFTSINLDLIFGTPGSTQDDLGADLQKIATLSPEHVAVYCLMFEPGTPLTELRDHGYVREIADEDEAEHFDLIRRSLIGAGFEHYEISNYARPGFACLHNQIYWRGGEYIGCGPSAHSHWRGRRYGNVKSLQKYIAALRDGGSARDQEETLDRHAKARETFVMNLRMIEGVDVRQFETATGLSVDALCGDSLHRMVELGMIEQSGGRVHLAEQALFVSDAVFAELV